MTDQNLNALEAQLRECFGRVVYAHKTHEKCSDICHRRLGTLKLIQIILSAIITGGIVTVLLGSKEVSYWSAVVSGLFSTALLAFNAYMKDVDPGQTSEKHKLAASELWDIRESYLSLITDLHSGATSTDEVRARRDELQGRLVNIYESAPRTNVKAYGMARAGLRSNEELTFSEAELDSLLPEALRSSDRKMPD